MTLDDRVAAALSRPRFNATLLAAFAGVALLLAAIGVYGVLSYTVASRMREIGVRLALGAEPNQVVRLVIGQGVRLAAIGAAAGLVAAVIVTKLMRSLIVGAAESDLRIFFAAIAIMVSVAAAAAFLPARRASTVDPVVVLRAE